MLLSDRSIIVGTGISGGGCFQHRDPMLSMNVAGMTGTTTGTFAAGNDSRFSDFFSLVRSSDLSMAASASVSAALSVPYAIGETWTMQYVLHIQSTAGIGGINFKLGTLPSSAVGRLAVVGPSGLVSSLVQAVTSTLTTAVGGVFTTTGTGIVQVFVTVLGGTAAGTIDLMMSTGLLQAGTLYRESQVWARRT